MAITIFDDSVVMTDNRTTYTGVFYPKERLLLIKENDKIRFRFSMKDQESAYRFFMKHLVGSEY